MLIGDEHEPCLAESADTKDFILRMFRIVLALLGLWAATGTVSAQPKYTLPAPKQGRLDNLVPVTAPLARSMALSEMHGYLAFCHERPYQDGHVSLVRLDAKGNPAAYAIAIKLPRADSLAKFPNYALAAAFHPKLPLLYVWQDIAHPYIPQPQAEPPELKNFDHLLIYSLAKETPELIASLCRGPDYIYGHLGGALAVDPAASFLYVPNLKQPGNPNVTRFGRFLLDGDGLPDLGEKENKLPLPVRMKRLAELNAAKPLVPHELSAVEYFAYFTLNSYGTGLSFLPVSKEASIVGVWNGLATWRPGDKDCRLAFLPLRSTNNTLMVGHPTLPVLFVTGNTTDAFYRVEHAEGYLSLLPQEWVLPQSKLSSPPAVLAKGKKVAVGGRHFVYVVSLDENGRPLAEAMQVQVFNPEVRALQYSERFDRLYVAVEVSK